MKKFIKALALVALTGSTLLPAVAAQEATSEFDGETVTVGVASEYEEEVWLDVADRAAEEGITLDIVLFNDYVQPNVAVQDGSLDLNAFQHVEYLNDWNGSNDGTLQAIGFTYVAPLKIYSDKISSVDELQDGDIIAIPNDPTNGGRALLALEKAGLIEVDDAAGILPTVNDITQNDLNLEFEELEAGQIATALPDVAAAAINNNFANDAGLTDEEAIFNDAEDIENLPENYKNIIATRSEDAQNALYLHIVELYQADATEEKLTEVSKGSDVPAWSEEDALPLNLTIEGTEDAEEAIETDATEDTDSTEDLEETTEEDAA